ncbi:EpsG family protein [Pseudomonas nabeulensis]|uniref:EpsG family protein n=1 Tax=Pseudomonas nabeulensis TaxID=2293833 RepID=A0A4Z0B1H3_9PSED|nr:EpsG family protein [Pseudomonas nabeulensis]TFY92299.1 EpsG family protein [Pseudomonas nabeulensis]
MTFYLLGYLIIFYIAALRLFALRNDLPLTLALYILIGIVGGIRFETGMDWPQYADYFDSISIEQTPIESYLSNNYKLAFEFGYFILNYFIKLLGGSISFVFLIASLFCALCTYLLSSTFTGNRIFIFTIYVSYNFIYMHFSTVRQSIAAGLFFLGLWAYLKLSNNKLMLLLFALSACFQISSLLYIFIFFCSFLFRNIYRCIFFWTLGTSLLFASIHMGSSLYKLLSSVLPTPFASKLMEYETWDYTLSIRTYLFGLYIAGCALNLGWLAAKKKKHNVDGIVQGKEEFALKIATTSLMLSATLILLFPNNFALWTRVFNVASVLFACALSTFYYSTPKKYKLIFIAHTVVAAISFVASLYAAQEAMVPYKTVW